MAKIPFTLDVWLEDKSQKIETRNGRPVHFIGLDRAGWQVFEVFRTNGTSEYRTYHDSYMYCGPEETAYDLFIVTPEEEMSEFVKEYCQLYKEGYADGQAGSEQLSDAILKASAAELLALARKELSEQIVDHKKEAYENGKAQALKTLPRWKPAATAYDGDRLPRIDWSLKRLVARFDEGIFYLDMNDLYKLPGFKEDE